MSGALARDLTCRELVELVTDYLEEVLPIPERNRFERHVAECEGCGAYLRQMRDTLRGAGRLSARSLPDEARETLLDAFRDWKRRRRRPSPGT